MKQQHIESGRRWALIERPLAPSWEFREGVDSAGGVDAIVVCCSNISCNAIDHNGRKNIAFFLPF